MTLAEQKNRSKASRAWDFLRGTVPEVYHEQFLRNRAQTNLSRMLVLSFFIICVQLALNLINIIKPQSGDATVDVMKFVILSLITLGLGIVFFVLGLLARRGVLRNERLLRALPFVLLYVYVGIQLIFFSFNVQSDTGSNSIVIAMLIAGLFLVVSPLQSILTIGAIYGLQFFIMYCFQDVSAMWNTVMLTDSWANLTIIALLIIYIACIMFDVYLRNFLNQTRLEGSNRQLEKIAQTDSLTEILNRRGFFKTVDRDWEEYISHNKLVAVCMFDIDYFKRFNDEHGHLLGDDCLRMVGQRLQTLFDKVDGGVVCRYGGEEFLAVFRGRDALSVVGVAEKACQTIREGEIEGAEGQVLRVTISGGLAYDNGEAGCDALIRLADDALYQAKADGRNRISVSK